MTRAPNPDRGELEIILDGQAMGLRPTFDAVNAFERSTGKGLIALTRDAINGGLTLGETAQIICECVKAWGRATEDATAERFQADRIAALVLTTEGGLMKVTELVAGLLMACSTGGVDAEGNVRPKTTTSPTT